MSSGASVCRICLAVDVTMYRIAESPLQLVYERLTTALLHSPDRRPVTACYLCCAQLNTSRKLMLKATKAEIVLTAILQTSAEVKKESVSPIDRKAIGLCGALTVSKAEYFDNYRVPGLIQVKPEPIEVKTEPRSEDEADVEMEVPPLAPDTAYCDSPSGDYDVDDPIRLVPPCRAMASGNVLGNIVEDEDRAKPKAEESLGDKEHEPQTDPRETGEKSYRSDISESKTLKIYSAVPTGEKHFACTICRRSFARKHRLISHLRAHTGEKPFQCDICQRRFTDKYIMRNHIKLHNAEKPHKCNICGRSFRQKSHLTSHLFIHTGEKPFKCDSCPSRFNKKSNLNLHSKLHSGVPYKCSICEKGFLQKSHLDNHSRQHTGEKPFECKICHSCFMTQSRLKKHSFTHTGEKRFECNICKRRFSQNGHLKLHKRTHTGEKPFECEVCQRRFTRKDKLRSHLKVHTGVCRKRFRQSTHLQSHSNVHRD